MTEKSYVTIRRVCLVCCVSFDAGALLLDAHLKDRFEKYTRTGWGLCIEHQRLYDKGFVALVECDPTKTGVTKTTQRVNPNQAHRTGRLAHVKRDVFERVFKQPRPNPVVFVPPSVIEWLRANATDEPDAIQ